MTLRIAQLTDIHLRDWSGLRARHFFSKRATGYFNYQLKRRNEYRLVVLDEAMRRIRAEGVDLVLVTGDVSNLGLHEELTNARTVLDAGLAGVPWFVIPGNHDRYGRDRVPANFEEVFAAHIADPVDDSLPWPRVHRVGPWHLVMLDSAIPVPVFRAWGRIGELQLSALRQYLKASVASDEHVFVAVHHHPSVAQHHRRDERRNLRDAAALRALLAEHPTRCVIHGHNHYFDVRNVQGHAMRLFGLSSSISSVHDDAHRSGQFAVHTLTDDGTVLHEVATWNGSGFSELRAMDNEGIRDEDPSEIPG